MSAEALVTMFFFLALIIGLSIFIHKSRKELSEMEAKLKSPGSMSEYDVRQLKDAYKKEKGEQTARIVILSIAVLLYVIGMVALLYPQKQEISGKNN